MKRAERLDWHDYGARFYELKIGVDAILPEKIDNTFSIIF
jgi:hypothetical protein